MDEGMSWVHEELKSLREKVNQPAPAMTREEFAKLFILAAQAMSDGRGSVVDALYPLFSAIDLKGKTLVINIPMPDGPVAKDIYERYCAYIDHLKSMGAANAIFLPNGVTLAALSDEDLSVLGYQRSV